MMRRTTSALASVVALALGVFAGCAEDRPPAASSASGDAGAGPGTSTADASIHNPAFCEGLELGGEVITEIERVGTVAEPIGGELLEGTYDLRESTVYLASNPDCVDAGASTPPPTGEPDDECPAQRRTDRVRQATLVVAKYAVQRVEASGVGEVGAPSASAMVYEIDGTSLVTTSLCPTGDVRSETPYSASGAALTLFFDDREELFVRRP